MPGFILHFPNWVSDFNSLCNLLIVISVSLMTTSQTMIISQNSSSISLQKSLFLDLPIWKYSPIARQKAWNYFDLIVTASLMIA